LRSSTNTLVARYIYDGWGKLLEVRDASGNAITSSTHIANLNSLRYRGYFYDTETKLYYLQSRYYDPQVQRFISPDVLFSDVISKYFDKKILLIKEEWSNAN